MSTFWLTQPVTDSNVKEGQLAPKKTPKSEPYPLTDGMEWITLDITQEVDMNKVYHLLMDNYVSDVKEDQSENFRFAYSIQLLRWALQPPKHHKDWWIGIKKGKKLVSFISAIPITISVNKKEIEMAEVNFLCVHKSLRAKQLAPLLIQEVTRRVHLTDKWQAIYTAGHKLPGIVTTATYFHRSINIEKLIKVGFASPTNDMDNYKRALLIKYSPLKLRLLEQKDIDQCFDLFIQHNTTKSICPVFTKEEFYYWLKPLKSTIWTYVVEENGKILDFVSFYHVSTTALKSQTRVKIAYLWFYTSVHTQWDQLLESLLYVTQQDGFDCFNVLEGIGGDVALLESLKFVRGDGTLYYYLYNWKCEAILPQKMGVFLL